MSIKPRAIHLLILWVTASLIGRMIFVFIDDTEGTNLLVTVVTGLLIFLPSLLAYSFLPFSLTKKIMATIAAQILIATSLYFLSFYF